MPFTQGLALTSGGAEHSPQIDHIAFKAKDVPAIAARLKAANVKFDRDLHDGIYGLTIYVFDPDGNMIELYEEGEDAVSAARDAGRSDERLARARDALRSRAGRTP